MDKITGFNKFRSPNNYFEFKENIIDEEIIKRMEENILYAPECVVNCIKNWNKLNNILIFSFLLIIILVVIIVYKSILLFILIIKNNYY